MRIASAELFSVAESIGIYLLYPFGAYNQRDFTNMDRYKYSDLLLYEEKARMLYGKLGLNYNSSCRIAQYFAYLSEIEKRRGGDRTAFNAFIQQDRVKYYYSQFYVLEICHILDAIERANITSDVAREKLDYLAQGTYLLSEETLQNAAARNTEFELSLFTFFYDKGVNAKLCAPNPDISVTTKNFVYNIECKRPFLSDTVEKNMRKALKQLRKSYSDSTVPTLALSLDYILGRRDIILDADNESSALSSLEKVTTLYSQQNLPMVRKIFNYEPCVILYYLSCLSGFKDNTPMAHAMFMVGNVYNFPKELSKKIYSDLEVFKPQFIR